MSYNTLLVVLLCSLFLATITAEEAAWTCSQSREELRAAREAATVTWTERCNRDGDYYISIANAMMTDDHISQLVQIGKFAPKIVAAEYGLNLFLTIAGQPPGVTLKQQYDPLTIVWDSDDQLHHIFTLNVTAGYNATKQGYNIQLDGVRQRETLIFEPCSTRIKIWYIVNDELAQRAYDQSSAEAGLAPEVLCFAAMLVCPVGTPLQQYESLEDCLAYNMQVPQRSICPHPFASNTMSCRALHLRSSFLQPDIHCPHIGKNSAPCQDTCLSACSNCDPNADCVALPSEITFADPQFACRCRPGFAGNGTSCAPVTCSQQYQCPGDYNSVRCEASTGRCNCAPTFVWNATAAAGNRRAQAGTCTCPPNNQIIWRNGVTECVPLGRCYEQYQCPQTYNSVKCAPYGSNPYRTYNTCQCNYGFLGGFELPCVCPTGRRTVYSSSICGNVCLSATECTEDWHCRWPKKCRTTGGANIGTCS